MPTSTPSPARYSRVPSVANISTSRAWRSRASAAIPSRFATDSRARTRGVPPPHRASDRGRTAAAEYSVRHGILRPDRPRPTPPDPQREARCDAAALGLPVHCRSTAATSRTCSTRRGSRPGPADRADRPVQRAHAGAPPAPALRRPVGVAVVDRADHVQPADDRGAFSLRLHPGAGDRDHRPRRRSSGSGSCASRRSCARTSSGSPGSATSRSRSSPTPRRPSAAAAVADAASAAGDARRAMPIEVRRFGVGHRRPDGPPGTVGVTGQPIHC